MRSFLLILAIVAAVGGPFWMGSRMHARGSVPEAFRRSLPPEVLQWEVELGTSENPMKALGPLRVGGSVAKSEIDKLGEPTSHLGKYIHSAWLANPTKREEPGFLEFALYGEGFFVCGNEISVYGIKQFRVIKMVLGNPWAMSAEDPIVKACVFKLPNGIKFGMGIEEVERRLKELAPTHGDLVPRTYEQGYFLIGRHTDGIAVTMHCGTFHYMNDQLVALVLQ